jgi:hypothetical protein
LDEQHTPKFFFLPSPLPPPPGINDFTELSMDRTLTVGMPITSLSPSKHWGSPFHSCLRTRRSFHTAPYSTPQKYKCYADLSLQDLVMIYLCKWSDWLLSM